MPNPNNGNGNNGNGNNGTPVPPKKRLRERANKKVSKVIEKMEEDLLRLPVNERTEQLVAIKDYLVEKYGI